MLRGSAGFTLIELMVVIVILSLLAAVVVPRFMIATDDAKVAAAKTQIANFRMTLDMYKLKFGNYPKTSEGLNALINNPKQNLMQEESIPPDPWGNPYLYTCPGQNGRDYDLVSYGADGVQGGDGFNADVQSWNLQAKQ
ncbi:MAG: type II secretion system major pseudopilin GspG [Candidatus Hydrogenedentes bacterium]|nr:type II secretion system major pseudopilin GspG [Candidatus Hydrogenedentota bacterium]